MRAISRPGFRAVRPTEADGPDLTASPESVAGAAGVTGAGTADAPAGAGTAASGRRWRSASIGLAAAAGLALTAAFPPIGIWPLAIAGPALLVLALRGKSIRATFGLALVCGTAFFVPLLSWVVNVAWYAWAALAILEILIFAVLTLGLRPLLRLRAWPVAVAGWWVLQEAVRDRTPWGGFPWGRLAMSQPSSPAAGWARIGGPPLLTFAVALAGACAAWLLLVGLARRGPAPDAIATSGGRDRAAGPRRLIPAALSLLAIGMALAGNLFAGLAWSPAAHPRTAVVATIQGNVPHSRTLPNLLRASIVTANHAAATIAFARQVRAGIRPAPDLVIWPENSTDIDPSTNPVTFATIASAVNAIDRPVLVGAVLDHPRRNAGQLWLPSRGPVQQYIKRQLVPFGEVIPFRSFLLHFTSLPKLQPLNFSPGHQAVVFRIGAIRLGDVICYEVGFDNLVRSEVLAGANLLTEQTNDATFEVDGQLGETMQQLAMARIDAITTGRAVAVASTTGISAIIAPDGTELARTQTWRRAVLELRVPLESGLTPADRVGAWPELVIAGLTIVALGWAILSPRVSGRRKRAQ